MNYIEHLNTLTTKLASDENIEENLKQITNELEKKSNLLTHHNVSNGFLNIWTDDSKIEKSIFAQQDDSVRSYIYSLIDDKNYQRFQRNFSVNSRPNLERINYNEDLFTRLKQCLFNVNGKFLNNLDDDIELCADIDIKPTSAEKNNDSIDERHQFIFKENSNTAKRIRNQLYINNIVSANEHIYEVVLIIGGTINQHLHFDFPRMFINDIEKTTIAFEINRNKYNNDMESNIAPSSILFDLTPERTGINIGVLNDFIIIDAHRTLCTIRNGRADEHFLLTQQKTSNKFTTVINDKQGIGLRFVGDFPHFGAINATTQNQMNTLRKFRTALEPFRNSKGFKLRETFNALEKIDRIDNICRLFIKTRPNTACKKSYAQSSVGIIEYDEWEITKKLNYSFLPQNDNFQTTNKLDDNQKSEKKEKHIRQINLNKTPIKRSVGRPRKNQTTKDVVEVDDNIDSYSDNEQQLPRKRGRPPKSTTNLHATTPPEKKKQKKNNFNLLKTPPNTNPVPNILTVPTKKKPPTQTPQTDNNVKKSSKPNTRLTPSPKKSINQNNIIRHMNIENGIPYWLSPRTVGLPVDISLKAFYHGNHLFVVQEISYKRAQFLFRKLFKPVSPAILCGHCKNFCPNMSVHNSHSIFFNLNNYCPVDDQLEKSSVTPAFYIPGKIISFLQAFSDEISLSKNCDFPLDLLNGMAEYRNFFDDTSNQFQKEDFFIQSEYEKHHFLILLEAALLTFDRTVSYNPPLLSIPYFSVPKIRQFVLEYKVRLTDIDLQIINKKIKKIFNFDQPEMPIFAV
jgi:hypothetical protein